jgi:hypothetical protein
MTSKTKGVIKHLKEDSLTWLRLERTAKKERMADLREIRRLKK